MNLDAVTAEILLMKCQGDTIWSEKTCRAEGIPEPWIEELVENYESGFDHDFNTIYEHGRLTNQYRGVADLKLAFKLAEFLGIDWQQATRYAVERRSQVAAIQAELDEI